MRAPTGTTATPMGATEIAQGTYDAPTKLKETPVAANFETNKNQVHIMHHFL